MAKKRFLDQLSQKLSGKSDAPDGAEVPAGSINDLREENLRLTRALGELSMLNDLAREIGASRSSENIMQRIIKRSLRSVMAEQAVITLVNEKAIDPMKTLVRATVTSAEHEKFHLNQNLLGWMHINKKPLLSNAPSADQRFRGITWDPSIRSILCVPLMVKSQLIGALTAYNKKDKTEFTEEDQRLLAIIAMQSGQVIENARLYEEEQAYMRMQEEVRLAAVIQMELLPGEAPTVAGYDIAGKSIPAQQVGGDYFDFIPFREGRRLAICLGDVSGKGLPASLLMANLQATLRSQTLMDIATSECMRRSNELLYRSTDPEKFATLFYGVLDLDAHQISYANAGHENPYVFSPDAQVSRLVTGGTILGAVESFPFEEDTIAMSVGETIVVFSDGITEAFDVNGKQFSDEALGHLLEEHHQLPAAQLIDRIIEAVKQHAGEAPQADDLTVVVVKRTGA